MDGGEEMVKRCVGAGKEETVRVGRQERSETHNS